MLLCLPSLQDCEKIVKRRDIMSKIRVCAPSRIYSAHPNGRFSVTGMIDYMSKIGFDGVDMSFDSLSAADDSYKTVLYAAKQRAVQKNLDIPSCHLPFYMPDPCDKVAMERFARDIRAGIDAAAIMDIPLAVIHPIALHGKRHTAETWTRANMEFLTPICEYAEKKGINLCIENMASSCEVDGDHLYGCTAAEILSLAEALDVGVCWDFGHANISGRPVNDVLCLKNKLMTVHAHDNNGYTDLHIMPFDGRIDWEAVARAHAQIEYNGYINVEVRAGDVPSDSYVREEFGRKILFVGQKIARLIES